MAESTENNIMKFQLSQIEVLLHESKSFIQKVNTGRLKKAIQILDRQFLQLSNAYPMLNIRIARRCLKANLKQIKKFVSEDEQSKPIATLLLERITLYISAYYIHLKSFLTDQNQDYSFKIQKIPVQAMKNKLIQQLTMNEFYITQQFLEEFPKDFKSKVKFYFTDFWILFLNCILSWASYYRQKEDIRNPIKFLDEFRKIIKAFNLEKSKNHQIIHLVATFYINKAQIQLQLYDFDLAIQNFYQGISFLQIEMNLILEHLECLNNIEEDDIAPIKQILQQICFILYLLSLLFEIQGSLQQILESLRLALWILIKILLDNSSQLFTLIFKAYEEAKSKYQETIDEEQEIIIIISKIFLGNYSYVEQIKNKNIELEIDRINKKMYLKYQYQNLNKTNYIYQSSQKLSESIIPYLNIEYEQSKVKENKDLPENSSRLQTKQTLFQSFTTNDLDPSRRFRTTEIGDQGQNTQSSIKKPKERIISQSNILELENDKGRKLNFSNFSKKQKTEEKSQNFFSYCKSDSRHQLNNSMAKLIVNSLNREDQQFRDYEDLYQNISTRMNTEYQEKRKSEKEKSILNFKKKFASTGQEEYNYAPNFSQIKREQFEIKLQYDLFHSVLQGQDEVKKIKLEKSSSTQKKILIKNQEKKQQSNEFKGQFKRIALKFGTQLGLRKIKKIILNQSAAQVQKKLKINNFLQPKIEEAKSEEIIQKEIFGRNQSVIEYLII